MQEMYNAKLGSPITTLAEDISSSQTTITVADASFLGAPPNIATITTGVNSETVKYTGITLNTLTGVTRGFQGSAQAWANGTNIARIITAYDHDIFKANIEEIFADVGDLGNLDTTDKTNIVNAINEVSASGGGGGSALDITYDNTTSELVSTNVQNAIDEVVVEVNDKAETITYTATLLSANWTGTEPATQTLSVTGILATDDPIADINFASITGYASQVEANTEWAKILQFTTSAGQVAFQATAIPTVDIPILLKVVR